MGEAHTIESAPELVDTLTPLLDALANIHYLLDHNIASSQHIRELRMIEDEVFEEMLRAFETPLSAVSDSAA